MQLARLLDGTLSRQDLIRYLEEQRASGALTMTREEDDDSLDQAALDSSALPRVLDRMLSQIAAKAVLAA